MDGSHAHHPTAPSGLTILWRYGDAWMDFGPQLLSTKVTIVGAHRTVHLTAPGMRIRHRGAQSLDGDGIPFEWTHLSSSGPCGITFLHRGGFHAGSPVALAALGWPDDESMPDLRREMAIAIDRVGDGSQWDIPGHANDPCGALHCLRA